MHTVVTAAAHVNDETRAGALLHGEARGGVRRCRVSARRASPAAGGETGVAGICSPICRRRPSTDRCQLLRRDAKSALLALGQRDDPPLHAQRPSALGVPLLRRMSVAAPRAAPSCASSRCANTETEIVVSAGFATVAGPSRGGGLPNGAVGAQDEMAAKGLGLASSATTRSPISRLVSSRSIAEPSRRVRFGT